jgi:hypothetical protein
MNGQTKELIPHSLGEATRALRVLNGKPKKYTCRIHKPDGSVIEYQSDDAPTIAWIDPARALWINDGYNSPMMPWESGMMMLAEENKV